MRKLLNLLIFYVTYSYYWVLLKTMRFVYVGREKCDSAVNSGLSPVFATPHCVLIPVILAYDSIPGVLLVSRSRDGRLIADILAKRNFKVVRGSSNRGSQTALKELITESKNGGIIGIAFDGPKGPPFVPKSGIIQCATHASGPLFFLFAKPIKTIFPLYLKLKTWDRMLLPLPFMKIEITCEPLPFSMPLAKEDINDSLAYLEKRAKEVFSDWIN